MDNNIILKIAASAAAKIPVNKQNIDDVQEVARQTSEELASYQREGWTGRDYTALKAAVYEAVMKRLERPSVLLYVIAWVAESLGLEGEKISFGNSFHRDGGWAAENYPQHYPGVIVDSADLGKIQTAGKIQYVNVRTQDEFGQWHSVGSGEEALKKIDLL